MKRPHPVSLDDRRMRWLLLLISLPVGFLGGVLWDITPVLYFMVIWLCGLVVLMVWIDRRTRER